MVDEEERGEILEHNILPLAGKEEGILSNSYGCHRNGWILQFLTARAVRLCG